MSTLVGGISLYAFISYFFVHSFFFSFYSGIETPDRNWQWYQRLLTLFAIFLTRAIPKGLTFGLSVYVLRLCNVHVLYCIQRVRDLNL